MPRQVTLSGGSSSSAAALAVGGNMILFGDSQFANGVSVGGTYPAFTLYRHQRDPMTYFQSKYGYPFQMPMVYRGDTLPLGANAAIGGQFGRQGIARFQNDCLSQKSSDVLWNYGTNDLHSSYTAADIMANTLKGYKMAMRAGVRRFWCWGVNPRHNAFGNAFSAPQEAQRLLYNQMIAAFAKTSGGTFIDLQPDPVMLDPSTGLLYISYSYDGLHRNARGAYQEGVNIFGAKWASMGGVRLPKAITDAYNSGTNPYGNVVTNFLLTGTSGTVAGDFTGTMPTSWRADHSVGTQTALCGCSIVSNFDIDGNTINKMHFALNSDGTTADTEQVRVQNTADFTTGLVKGGWFKFRAEVSVSAILTGANILRNFFLELDDNSTNGDVVRFFSSRYTDTVDSNTKDIFPVDTAETFLIESDPIYLKDVTGCRLKFYCEIDGTVVGTRSVDICNLEVVQIPDTRFDYIERVQTFTAAATRAILYPETTTLVINRASALATPIDLPAVPIVGRKYLIKDGAGNANFFNITLTPASGTIEGASTFVMNVARSSAEILHNGTEWSVV